MVDGRTGRPPLDEKKESKSRTFRITPTLLAEAEVISKRIGFSFVSEFFRYSIQQEVFKWLRVEEHQIINQMLIERNRLIAENIALRAEIKGKEKNRKEKKEKKEKKEWDKSA